MGVLRVLLALAVMFSHTGKIGSIEFINSGVAVYSFFIISGFYITLALDNKYVGNGSTYIFYINRYLRLWPTYAISLLIIFFHYVNHRAVAALFEPILSLPKQWTIFVLFSNISFFGIDLFSHIDIGSTGATFSEYGVNPKQTGFNLILNGPVWSIWAEMLFYLIAPFIVRSLKKSIIFMMIGVIYVVSLRFLPPELANAYRYDIYYPYFFPFFGVGAVAYWMTRENFKLSTRGYLYTSIISICFLSMPLYLGSTYYLIFALAIPKLFELTKDLKIDKFIGELAYPIYILHIPIHMMTNQWKWLPSIPLQTGLITILTSIVVVILIERPIANAREKWTYKKLNKSKSNNF